jgi:hypothetical protein
MADVVEVVARLGDSIVAVAHGQQVTVGETGDIYAPAPNVTFDLGVAAHTRTAGLLAIEIRCVAAAVDRVPRKRPDGRAAAYVALSLFVHLALWGTSMQASTGDGLVLPVGDARMARTNAIARVDLPEPYMDGIDGIDGMDGPPAPHISMAIAEQPKHGVGPIAEIAGHASVDIANTQQLAARVGDRDTRRARAIASAGDAGILGSDALGESRFGHLPGTGELANGFDGHAVNGGARGEPSTASSFAASRNLEGGCTHEPCGPIPAGRYGTICAGPGPECSKGGKGYGVERQHQTTAPSIFLCGAPEGSTQSPCVLIVGDLDKTIIRRYIRRKLTAITGCYEKSLLVDSALSGTVETQFLIDPTGHVRDITATGVSPEVSSCVATVISTIQFPLAKGGGSTQVHYPFSFVVAGG